MKAPQRTTVLNYIQTSLLIFFLITKSTFSGCPPYILPEIPTASDYNTILYVDPQAPTGGNGTIDKPYNTINGLTITPNTAYLIKAGTILYERVDRVWKNNMVGRYGEGDRPVVNHGFRFNEGVDGIVVRDLRIVREGTGTSGTASASSIFVNYGTPRNITIAFCDIEGIENPSMEYAYRYPAFGSTGAAGGSWVFYNNRIGNIGSKAFYTAAPNYVFVRNYVYNINRGAWTGEERDQESGIGHGNAFSYRFWRENAYIAGNYFDGYRDFDHSIMYAGKGIFGIMAGMDDLTPNNMVIEYNTIIGAPGITSTGGGSLYYDPPNETIFRYNVIDGSIKGQHHGLINIVGSQWATRLTYESGSSIWGIRNNHLIKATSNQDISWGTDSEAYIREEGRNNIIYDSWDAYNTDYEKESWGSDIDPDAFWVEFNCDTEYFNVEFDILDQQGEVIPQATITFAGKTNPIGDYSFTGIAPGTYSYIVSSPGFQNLTVTNLEIIDNTTISVQLTPIPVYSVIFNVISTGGTPINNAVISFNGITNPAGDYSFTAIPAGTYSYSVSATGYQVVSSNNLKIVENTSVQIQMTSVPPTTYSLSFVVTSDAGTLITNAVVTFNGVTNPEGNYSFTNIIAGTYSYSVSASGYQNKSVSNFQVTQNTSVAVQLDPLPPSAYTINFAVTSDAGTPIINAVVTFNGVTNPEGNYSFTNIIAGTYSYSVSASGYQMVTTAYLLVNQDTTVLVPLNSENHFNDEVVSITVKSDPPGMAFISGAGVYLVSNEVKISVEPIVDEFVFIGWKENDQIITKEETLNFIANNDREIIASFKPISRGFNILAQASFEDAGEISGIGYYSKGEIASIYYSDNQKYVFKGWINRAGQVVSRQNPFSFEVNRNIELTALLDVVEYNENDRLMVYPNPSNGLVFVKNTFIEDADIVVFNSSGNPVQNRKMISNDNMIDLTELPPGMYLLQFRFLNETIVRKILLN
jgi:hypothetical protein